MKRILIVLSLFMPGITAAAQNIISLRECLETGLERNYQLRMVRNDEQIASNNATIGNAGYLPTLGLNAGYSETVNNTDQWPSDGSATISRDGIRNRTANYSVGLNWTLFDGFRVETTYDRLRELETLGELNTRLTVEDFIANLAAEYHYYIQQNLLLKNYRYALDLSRERMRIVEAHYTIGSKSRLDLQQARVDLNADSSALVRQYEVVHTSRIRLNRLMALDNVDAPLAAPDSIILHEVMLDKNDLTERMIKENTSLLIFRKNHTISELDYKLAKSRNYPYIRINGGYGNTNNYYGSGTYDRQRTMGFNYGATLSFDLFDGTNRTREQKNARLAIDNRELALEEQELMLRAELSNIWMAYRNNLELMGLELQNRETARDNYDIAIERYKLGTLSGIELREAQTSLLSAEERLLRAEYNTKLCEISLRQISGQVTDYLQ